MWPRRLIKYNRLVPRLRFCIHFQAIRAATRSGKFLSNHATDIVGEHKNPGVAMEVGMHSANQCLEAAKAGLKAHCFEPSPTSFQRVKNQVEAQEMNIRKRVTIYNQAASSTSEGTIEFKSSGGTGDHVGGFDMWKMKASTDENDLKGEIVQVPQVRLDDVVSLQTDGVFALKVDTQGFEPIVFSGLIRVSETTPNQVCSVRVLA